MYENQRQQLSEMSGPVIANGCILSTNISQDTTDINGLNLAHSSLVGRNKTGEYDRSQEILINPQGGNIQSYSNDAPPKPPTRRLSNISRSRNGDYGGMSSSRSKSSSRGYTSRSRMEDQLADALNPELSRAGYPDNGQLVVSLPHTWTQQQQHRRGNQR